MSADIFDTAPIARVTVRDGAIVAANLYAPGLPDGKHDVWPCPVAAERLLRILRRADELQEQLHMPREQALELAEREHA